VPEGPSIGGMAHSQQGLKHHSVQGPLPCPTFLKFCGCLYRSVAATASRRLSAGRGTSFIIEQGANRPEVQASAMGRVAVPQWWPSLGVGQSSRQPRQIVLAHASLLPRNTSLRYLHLCACASPAAVRELPCLCVVGHSVNAS
jgi:hypothetical protein